MSPRDDRQRHHDQAEGDLARKLAGYLWNDLWPRLTLAGHEYTLPYLEEVPGYEDDHLVVLLRRESDWAIFEADITVSLRPAKGQP
jgi:hypothetical protein